MSHILVQAPKVASITILDLSQGTYIVILQYAGGTARSSRHFFSSYEKACAFATSYDLPIRNLSHKDRDLGTLPRTSSVPAFGALVPVELPT